MDVAALYPSSDSFSFSFILKFTTYKFQYKRYIKYKIQIYKTKIIQKPKNNLREEHMKPECGEFLKGGALSVDRLIKERAPPMLKNPYSSNQ